MQLELAYDECKEWEGSSLVLYVWNSSIYYSYCCEVSDCFSFEFAALTLTLTTWGGDYFTRCLKIWYYDFILGHP
jgi:hypothetical protein